MAGLQRSAVSFRRQGSSGLVWDDKVLLGELNNDKKPDNLEQDNPENKTQDNIREKEVNNKDSAVAAVQPSSDGGGVFERSRSGGGGGGRGYRTGKVSPAIEPPSPRISACGFCAAFGKENKNRRNRFSNGKRTGRSR